MRRWYVVLALALAATYAALYFLIDLSALLIGVALKIGVGFTWLTWLAIMAGARRSRTRATAGTRRGGADVSVAWTGGAAASVDCSGGASGFSGDCGAGAV